MPHRSWPDLEEGRTSRPRSWLTARDDQPGLSLERLCESGESGTPRFPNGSRRGSTIEVYRAKLSDLGDGGGDRRDPGTIHQEGSPGSQAGGVLAGPVLKSDGGEARYPDGRDQGRS